MCHGGFVNFSGDAPHPLRRLSPSEVIEHLWSGPRSVARQVLQGATKRVLEVARQLDKTCQGEQQQQQQPTNANHKKGKDGYKDG